MSEVVRRLCAMAIDCRIATRWPLEEEDGLRIQELATLVGLRGA